MAAVRWVVVGLVCAMSACGVSSEMPDAGGTSGGASGTGGAGGQGGVAGMAGSGGSGGAAGSAGEAGNAGTAGDGGTGGVGGTAGGGGTAGNSGAGGTGGTGGEPLCAIERDKRTLRAPNVGKVYYGTLMPSVVDLTPGQILAITKIDLEDVSTVALCSGTLVTPRWVLTAKHCTEGFTASNITVSVGANPAAPSHSFTVSMLVEHPTADVALLQLSENATDRLPELTPIRLFTGALDNSWLGRTVEAAGYGEAEDRTTGTRYFTAEPIDSLVADEVWIDGMGQRGVCGGDSGGPLLTEAQDGSVRVIGELHGGDSSCVGVDHYTRVDLYRTWIEQYVGPTPVNEDLPCGDLTAQGRCFEGTAVYCEDDLIRRDTCTGALSCGWSTGDSGFRCVMPATDPCEGYDIFGGCDGDVARVCIDGSLVSADCGGCGLDCVIDDVEGANCGVAPVDPCENLDYLGRCTGDVAEWCDNGVFKQRDCRIYGQTCAWRDGTVGYYCGT